MFGSIKSIITGCLVKLTSIADKSKADLITKEKARELLLDLIDDTCTQISHRRVVSFITDN